MQAYTREPFPLVSIGMPVYNCERTLAASVQSILNQTFENWELLIVDDGSTDRTVEVAQSFPDERIRVVADGEHKGLVARLNQAVAASRGKYFARTDGDDVAFPNRLKRQVEFLEEHQKVDLVGCGVVVFGERGAVLGTRRIACDHAELCRRPWAGFQLPHPTWLGRTAWFREHPYDASAVRAEDQVLLLRTHSTSHFASLPDILQGYRESHLELRKILRGRLSFTVAVFREYWSRKRYATALGGTLEQCAKGLLDIFAITIGLNYRILQHRARPAKSEMVARWTEVWSQLQTTRNQKSSTRLSSTIKRMNVRKDSSDRDRVRVVNVVTSSLSVRFLKGQPEYFAGRGYEVVVCASPGEELRKGQSDGVQTVAVSMAREISPLRDLFSLWALVRMMWRLRPTISNVATPKAGLLGGLAAWLCGVPCRYYTLHGLRCETATGLKRKLLILTERIACLCAHRVLCVSESLRQKVIGLGIVDRNRTVVLASGSYAGVDPQRFAPTAEALRRADCLHQDLGIPAEAPVIGFVGRLTKDKGIRELVEAYLVLQAKIPELRLLLVGDTEEGDPLPPQILCLMQSEPRIVHTGFVQNPADYYHVMDVFAFPTHREGFGNVALEANAAGKPVVAARATGVLDAVIDGVTGILVPIGDSHALASALARVIEDRRLAAALGSAGRERVLREFRQEIVWDALAQEYLQLLRAKGLTVPTAATRKEAAVELATGAALFQ